MDTIEEKANKLGYKVDEEYLEFPNTIFKGIKVVQTILVSDGVIYIHPVTLGNILSKSDSNEVIDIIKRKG